MQIKAHGLTDQGKVRRENQDAFFIDEARRVYAVADGLGGLPGGADASRRIVELLKDRTPRFDSGGNGGDLADFIIGINQIIANESADAYPITGSGSTLTLCRIVNDQLLIGHVGDSAAYLLREGRLEKLTMDHTMEQELISEHGEAARQHMPPEYPHTLTRCIGQETQLRVDQTRVQIRPGDRILLCTDGLNKVVAEHEIAETLGCDLSAEQIATRLTEKANDQSGPDNITVISLILSD
ncbi:MAG TPA: protein phosphatase 2C domain-containing protein [Opitutales bacterium]|nr:protein phosphatase 2C domain-containing protein [Opitutales bacterium]